MHEGYGSPFVSGCVCYRTSSYIPSPKWGGIRFLVGFKYMYCVKLARSGGYGIVCLPRWSVTRLFLNKNHTNVYELLARSAKLEQLSLIALGSTLDSFLWTPQSWDQYCTSCNLIGVGTGGGHRGHVPPQPAGQCPHSQSSACSCSNRPDYEIS